jgi:tetratricopeptide (TPR) repeat protein
VNRPDHSFTGYHRLRAFLPLGAALVLTLGLDGPCAALDPHGQALERAREAFAGGASELAAGVLDRLLGDEALSPGVRSEAGLLRAQICIGKGEFVRAERLLAQREGEPAAALLLAQAALRGERWWPAAERFASARALGAEDLACALGRADALARLGRGADALAELRQVSLGASGSAAGALSFAKAGLLLDLGKPEEAAGEISRIQAVTPAEEATLALLRARLALAAGRFEEASPGFAKLMHPNVPVPPEVLAGAWLGEASVLEFRGDSAAAARLLLQFLKAGREVSCLDALLDKTVRLLSELLDPPVMDLEACTRVGSQNQRALALFHLAQFYAATGRTEKAAASHLSFCEQFENHRLLPVSLLQRAEIAMGAGRWTDAEVLLKQALRSCDEPRLRSTVSMRQGLVHMRKAEFEQAFALFEGVAGAGEDFRVEACFNAGLAAIRLGDLKRAQVQQELLGRLPGTDELVASLELEGALHRAAAGRERAHELLQAFIQRHPAHPRTGNAKVALAELFARDAEAAAADSRPAVAGALRDRASALLKAVALDPQSPQSAMHAKYLAVFLADSGGEAQPEEVLALGEAFLREHPDSALAGQMRMKLGEIYFRRKDFANAEEQFAGIASRDPEGPLSETALFLAGQCAASRLNPGSVDDALRYWERVAQGSGGLRWRARYQQAAVKSRIGEDADGAELFGRIVNASDPLEPELRFASRCGRADALLSLAKRGAVPLAQAIAEYEALATQPGVPPLWRNQALHKKAKAVEATQQQEALEGFYRVLDAPDSIEAGEFFWLFKAGFDAARILEGRQAWKDCVALYERLGRIDGPRSQEAKKRAFQIRLERFLWD